MSRRGPRITRIHAMYNVTRMSSLKIVRRLITLFTPIESKLLSRSSDPFSEGGYSVLGGPEKLLLYAYAYSGRIS